MKIVRLIVINLIVFIGLLGLCFLVIELWARLQPRSMFVEFDPLLGFRLKPNVEGVYRGLSALNPNPEIRTPVRTNSLGLRGPEVSPQKPSNTRRTLVLGDSFVEAFEVPYEETFYARLARLAHEKSGSSVEVIPMGVMGYGTAQELLWLRERGRTLQPDVVLLILFLGNDIVDNSRALHFSGGRPYFDLDDGRAKLVSLPNPVNQYKYWAAEHIRSFLLYKELGARLSSVRRILDRFSLSNNPTRGNGPRAAVDPNVRHGFDLTFALIKEMRRTAAEMGSPLLVAYYGDFQSGSAPDAQKLTAEFCDRERLECLNLNTDLAGDGRNVVPNDGHWSAAGHARVADLVWARWNSYFINNGKTDSSLETHRNVASTR